MKIFENKKADKTRTIKLFEYPIYIDEREKNSRIQFFLNGIIKTSRIWEQYREEKSEKNVDFFNKPFIKVIHDKYYIKKYLNGKLIETIDLRERFKKRYFRYIDKKHDDIYILSGNSGEIYLFLTHIAENFIKRNGSKAPLFVATKKYHIDLIRMLMPEIPYVYIKDIGKDILNDDVVEIYGKRLFLLFSLIHFKTMESNILNKPAGESHYFNGILERLGANVENLSHKQAHISKSTQNSMLEKVKKIGLNLDNFAFIAPCANSCEDYHSEFWVKLCERLKKQGVDVFFNIAKEDSNPIKNCEYKTCKLTFGEALALAKMSKQIVSLRSGLTELLLQADVPMHVIYTKFKNRTSFDEIPVELIASGFGLKALPNINLENLKEYNPKEISESEILNSIMNNINFNMELAEVSV